MFTVYRRVSVHRGVPGLGGWLVRGCMVLGGPGPRGCMVLGRGGAWSRGVYGPGGCLVLGGAWSQGGWWCMAPPPRCGRYASYCWNAFLLRVLCLCLKYTSSERSRKLNFHWAGADRYYDLDVCAFSRNSFQYVQY